MGKIIAISNQKGGVGKSTTAINLSACLAERLKKVLIIDLDPQGNTTSGLGIDRNEAEHTVYDLLEGGTDVETCQIRTEFGRLYVVPPLVTVPLSAAHVTFPSSATVALNVILTDVPFDKSSAVAEVPSFVRPRAFQTAVAAVLL